MNRKVDSLKKHVEKVRQQLDKATNPHLKAFLDREIKRTQSRIDHYLAGGK